MSDELKPCPHCGSSDFLTNGNLHPKRLACGNDACQMMGIWIDYDTWQSRPLEDALLKRAEAAEAKAERYENALQWIDTWVKAYPLDVFPEPDFKRVREALEAAGISLDCVSASCMRCVIQGVERITEEALKGGE